MEKEIQIIYVTRQNLKQAQWAIIFTKTWKLKKNNKIRYYKHPKVFTKIKSELILSYSHAILISWNNKEILYSLKIKFPFKTLYSAHFTPNYHKWEIY